MPLHVRELVPYVSSLFALDAAIELNRLVTVAVGVQFTSRSRDLFTLAYFPVQNDPF